jgi:hypothetical protein
MRLRAAAVADMVAASAGDMLAGLAEGLISAGSVGPATPITIPTATIARLRTTDAVGNAASTGRWLFQFGVCRETTMLQRSALILAVVLVAGSASASIAAGAKHSEHEKSYRRAPMWARSMAPRIESGAATTQNVKPFTIEEQRWFNQANGSRW